MKRLCVESSTGPATLGDLSPEHLQSWLKRLRKAIAPQRIRFYAVGEYGTRTWRPHFHVILYNFAGCSRGRTKRKFGTDGPDWADCCDSCRVVGASWGKGNIDIGSLTLASAAYCASYTLKRMSRASDPRLKGRHPEFCRMSLRPGIGSGSMWDVASVMLEYGLDNVLQDVPSSLAHGGANMPLGRYLRGLLRERIGRDKKAPQAVLDALAEEVRPLE